MADYIIETVEKPTRYRMYIGGKGLWTTNRKIAEVFSEHSRATLPLPAGGCWVAVEPETPLAKLERAREAAKGLIHFIDQYDRKPIRTADEFYGIHAGTEWEAVLRLSDLRALRDALKGTTYVQT